MRGFEQPTASQIAGALHDLNRRYGDQEAARTLLERVRNHRLIEENGHFTLYEFYDRRSILPWEPYWRHNQVETLRDTFVHAPGIAPKVIDAFYYERDQWYD